MTEGLVELDYLIDTEVVEIKLYGGIELIFGEARESVLQIESDFQVVRGHESVTVHFFPARDEESSGLNDLAVIFRKTVVAAVAVADGALILDFSNSVRLFVDHDDNYEAWVLRRRSGTTLVSLPGGGLG
ncbi:MAG: DUF6188 family protein [Acidimicrobiales bacterium]